MTSTPQHPNLSQPDARTCQSTCIAMALGKESDDIMSIRRELEKIGEPGDPAVMGQYLTRFLGGRYVFDDNASLSEIRGWLRDGEFLITHGWFTSSGHVIALDGVTPDPSNLSYKFSVKDPWSEFNFRDWRYDQPNVTFFDGDYSSYGLYASIVVGQSPQHAHQVYIRGELDSQRKGAWIHRIKPN